MKLIIFTPTYNREEYLPILYDSLLRQTEQSFQWIIVDDGSTDNTRSVVEQFLKDGQIPIVYYWQNNCGKHIAHNKGVELCDTELFFCVDSDDFLLPETVADVLKVWSSRNRSKEYIGIVALRGHTDGRIMGNAMPDRLAESSLSDLYNLYGKKGETALIFATKYLKKHMFPHFENEKFLSEEIIYNELENEGKFIVYNKVLYIMEYLENGLTKSYIKMWKSSPQGVKCLLHSRYKKALLLPGWKKFYRSIRVILLLNAFCHNRGMPVIQNSPNKFLSATLYLPSLLISHYKFG
jgi:glycosyltransferase involved in cell wall biosynthesis